MIKRMRHRHHCRACVHMLYKVTETKGTACTSELEPTVNPVSRRAPAEEHCPQISMHLPLARFATAAVGSATPAAKCRTLLRYRPPWAIVLSHRRLRGHFINRQSVSCA